MNTQVAVSALLVFSSTDTAGYAVTRLVGDRPRHGGHARARSLPVPGRPAHAARGALARVAAGLADALRTSTALVEHADDGDRRGRPAAGDRGHRGPFRRPAAPRPQIASAAKATRWAIVRRSAMRATAELEPTRALAVRLARDLEIFAAEVSTFSARPTFGDDPMLRAGPPRATGRAVGAGGSPPALTGQPYAEDLERAQAAVEQFPRRGPTAVWPRWCAGRCTAMVDDLAAFRP
jgi:hypothetical protein